MVLFFIATKIAMQRKIRNGIGVLIRKAIKKPKIGLPRKCLPIKNDSCFSIVQYNIQPNPFKNEGKGNTESFIKK